MGVDEGRVGRSEEDTTDRSKVGMDSEGCVGALDMGRSEGGEVVVDMGHSDGGEAAMNTGQVGMSSEGDVNSLRC